MLTLFSMHTASVPDLMLSFKMVQHLAGSLQAASRRASKTEAVGQAHAT